METKIPLWGSKMLILNALQCGRCPVNYSVPGFNDKEYVDIYLQKMRRPPGQHLWDVHWIYSPVLFLFRSSIKFTAVVASSREKRKIMQQKGLSRDELSTNRASPLYLWDTWLARVRENRVQKKPWGHYEVRGRRCDTDRARALETYRPNKDSSGNRVATVQGYPLGLGFLTTVALQVYHIALPIPTLILRFLPLSPSLSSYRSTGTKWKRYQARSIAPLFRRSTRSTLSYNFTSHLFVALYWKH